MESRPIQVSIDQLRQRLVGQAYAQTPDHELLARYAQTQDQNAFEALVRRHGPMVMNVLRRSLHNEADVEDAFQATFIVLARKAGSIRQGELLGNWLHGVAHRVALKSRVLAARRLRHENQAAQMRTPDVASPTPSDDTPEVLDAEIRRLPARFREPLVLCYLQGKSREEAASELGCTASAVKGNLERGRNLLRKRLKSRGVATLGIVGASTLLADSASAHFTNDVKLSQELIASTLQSVQFGATSSSAVMLANSVLKTMAVFATKTSVITGMIVACVLGTGLLGSRLGWNATPVNSGREPAATQVAKTPESPSPANDCSADRTQTSDTPAATTTQDTAQCRLARLNPPEGEDLAKRLGVLIQAVEADKKRSDVDSRQRPRSVFAVSTGKNNAGITIPGLTEISRFVAIRIGEDGECIVVVQRFVPTDDLPIFTGPPVPCTN